MKITLNDRSLTLTQPVTLDVLLTEHHHPWPGIAMAVNQTIIPAPAVDGIPGAVR